MLYQQNRRGVLYQWKEHENKRSKKKVGGEKTTTRAYTYEQVWSDELLDSSSYREPGHQNSQSKGYESQAWDASKAKLGAFSLGGLTARLDDWKPVTVEKSVKSDLKLADGGLYRSASPTTPAVGDLRIRLEKVPLWPHLCARYLERLGLYPL